MEIERPKMQLSVEKIAPEPTSPLGKLQVFHSLPFGKFAIGAPTNWPLTLLKVFGRAFCARRVLAEKLGFKSSDLPL